MAQCLQMILHTQYLLAHTLRIGSFRRNLGHPFRTLPLFATGREWSCAGAAFAMIPDTYELSAVRLSGKLSLLYIADMLLRMLLVNVVSL